MNTRAIIAVIAFAIVAGAFGQEYSADAVVPETAIEEPQAASTFDDGAVYSDDKLPYQTDEIDQEHEEEVPVYTTEYHQQDEVRYEPTEVTKQEPEEVYYTEPVEEKTTEDWTNVTEKVLMPYWKKVSMKVKVSIPIDVVRYKPERKQIESDDSVLKKVYVPKPAPTATGSAAAPMESMVEELEERTTAAPFPTMMKPTMKNPLVPVDPYYAEPTYEAPAAPVPTTSVTPVAIKNTYASDDLPYETRTIHQTHTVQTPVQSTRYVRTQVYRYEPETITKEVPTEVYYTKPITEKTTDTWHNESFKELVPYWKKVTMTVNVTIPISVVRYKPVVKTVEGNETVLKKVFVPRSEVDVTHANKTTATNKTKATAVAPMEELGVGNDTMTTYKTLPGPIAGHKTVYMPEKVTVERAVPYTQVVPQTHVDYTPTTVTDDVKVPLPSWEQDSKTYRNVTSFEPVEHTIHIVKPMLISFMTQDLKWKEVPEKVEVVTTTRGTDQDEGRPHKYISFSDGNDVPVHGEAPETEELQYVNITYTHTMDGPIAYKKVVERPVKTYVQKPVVYRTMVPQEQVHYQTQKVVTHVKVPLPSWEQNTKSFHNVTKWTPVPKTLHIVKDVPIEFMTQELKWTHVEEPVEHVTVTRGDDEDTDTANRYIDYSSGEGEEAIDYHDDLLEVEAEEED